MRQLVNRVRIGASKLFKTLGHLLAAAWGKFFRLLGWRGLIVAGFIFAIALGSFAVVADKMAWWALAEAPGRLVARGLAALTGDEHAALVAPRHPQGFLYIESPQVYTRERLVNDRFREAAWLERALAETEAANAPEQPSRRQRTASRTEMSAGGAESKRMSADGGESPNSTALDEVTAFKRRVRLRESIRLEQMDSMLDDAHDLDGNTLYRLNFDATVVPYVGRRDFPGSAVFVLTAKRWSEKGATYDPNLDNKDNVELLIEFEKELQNFVSKAYDLQMDQFRRFHRISNPFNSSEALAFENFLWTKIISIIGSKKNDEDIRQTILVIARTEILRAMLLEARNEALRSFTPDSEKRPLPTPCKDRLNRLVSLSLNMNETSAPSGSVKPCRAETELSAQRGLVRLAAVLQYMINNKYIVINNENINGSPFSDILSSEEIRSEAKSWLGVEMNLLMVGGLNRFLGTNRCASQLARVDKFLCLLLNQDASAETEALFAEFLQLRLADKMKEYFPGAAELLPFFDVDIESCPKGRCTVRLTPKYTSERYHQEHAPEPSEWDYRLDIARDFIQKLEDRRADLAVYAVSPRRIGMLTDALTVAETGIAATLGSNAFASGNRAVFGETLDDPIAVGFSDLVGTASSKQSHPRNETTFGWIVRPLPLPDGRGWRPEDLRLSAILSVPSWWKRVEIEIKTCWVTPYDTARFAEKIREEPVKVCDLILKLEDDVCSNNSDAKSADKKVNLSCRTVLVQLPRRIDEVRTRYELEVLKAPYFDTDWIRNEAGGIILESGRPGSLVLVGERLWRSTEVTLGGVRASSIRVLPDMKGIFAEFDCVPMPPGHRYIAETPVRDRFRPIEAELPGSNRWRESLQSAIAVVWTAEGRTTPLGVALAPFVRRSEGEEPCTPRLANLRGR